MTYVNGREFTRDATLGTTKEACPEWVGTFIRTTADGSDPSDRIIVRTHADTPSQAHDNLIAWRNRRANLRATEGTELPVFILVKVDQLYPFCA